VRRLVSTSTHRTGAPRRLVQISDTHLSRWDGPLRRNFLTLVDFVNTTLKPDLVVHTGDVTLSNPDSDEDFAVAKELHRRIDAPIRLLPGNHDVGEAYDRSSWWATNSARLTRFEQFFEPTPWLEWLGGVGLVGLNSQVLGSGLPEELKQWKLLEEIAEKVFGKHIIVFLHRSFWTPFRGSDRRPGSLSREDRERILKILGKSQLLGVVNGDLHRYKKGWRERGFELWGPSTSFLVHREESARLPAGLEQLGVVLFEIQHERVRTTFQTVPGLEEVEVGQFAEARPAREEVLAAIRASGKPSGPPCTDT